jgi:hypothetical protein
MAKKLACDSIAVRDNLLARLLNIFYIIPPVVNKTAAAIEQSLIKRSLPVPCTPRFSGRARDLHENKESASALTTRSPVAAGAVSGGRASKPAPDIIEQAILAGTGKRSFLSATPAACRSINCLACACCGCKCDQCRKKAQEWLLPRLAGVGPPLVQATNPYDKRLHLIRNPGKCVFGVLACGYVLSGSGSVKSRSQKRA